MSLQWCKCQWAVSVIAPQPTERCLLVASHKLWIVALQALLPLAAETIWPNLTIKCQSCYRYGTIESQMSTLPTSDLACLASHRWKLFTRMCYIYKCTFIIVPDLHRLIHQILCNVSRSRSVEEAQATSADKHSWVLRGSLLHNWFHHWGPDGFNNDVN